MGFTFLSRSPQKPLYAKISTMDADLEKIVIEPTWTGRHLYEAACRIIGLRESWFFGLQFTNKKQLPCWLQMDKQIRKQDISRGEDGSLQFLFLVKFYPEDVETELIQDLTRHLFFLQIKQAILSMELYCSPEAAVLLASYAAQAMYGDYNEETEQLELEKLIPKGVMEQYDMTADMWREKISRWWVHNATQTREDAEMEYLRVAQDLEMYGIMYYPICNKKETDLHLGISALGLGIYKGTNRITPRPFFSWSEIKNIQFKNKMFYMKTVDKSSIDFKARDSSINPSILDLCIGTHNLYLKRRQPDTLEVQQMKAQAHEERMRRTSETKKLAQEKEERKQIESEQIQLKAELEKAKEQIQQYKELIRMREETAEQLIEKARASEQEALRYMKRANEAEAECHLLKMNHAKSEEAFLRMERKAREAELYAQRISMSLADVNVNYAMGDGFGMGGARKPHYASHAVISEPSHTMREIWTPSTHHMALSAGNDYPPPNGPELQRAMSSIPMSNVSHRAPLQYSHSSHAQTSPHHHTYVSINPNGQMVAMAPAPPPPDPAMNQLIDLHNIRGELEKGRHEYSEKARAFKDKLNQFRHEIEGLKKEDRQTEHDIIHQQNLQNGFDKNTTLRMMPSPQKRASASTTDSKIDVKRPKLSSSSSDTAAKTPTTVKDETTVEEPRDKPLSVEPLDERMSMLRCMRIRRSFRLCQYSLKFLKNEVVKQMEEVDQNLLQLHNSNSEIQHIYKEINKCLSFR
ncbi:hypothetical protein WR25_20246 [Diploscapter pachys]|uniref:FERM domain-containing protein n=1 Tax=Diploscapter pachys TaxID=2018661 RepID=A0A2A2LP86_9BILA|nr:hypothetical protein WR25_20246 [Diploscapter pachys]